MDGVAPGWTGKKTQFDPLPREQPPGAGIVVRRCSET